MKRYKKNEIKSYFNAHKTIIISSIFLIIAILILYWGFEFISTTLLFVAMAILVPALFLSLMKLIFGNRHINYSLNHKRIEQKIDLAREKNNMELLALSLVQMGTLFGCLKKHEKELDYYYQAWNICSDMNFNDLKMVLCQPIGAIFEKLKEPNKAEEYYLTGLKLAEDSRDVLQREFLSCLGELHEKFGDTEKSRDYYFKYDNFK